MNDDAAFMAAVHFLGAVVAIGLLMMGVFA